MAKHTAYPQDSTPPPVSSTSIIQFGILCCAVALVIVLTIALLAL